MSAGDNPEFTSDATGESTESPAAAAAARAAAAANSAAAQETGGTPIAAQKAAENGMVESVGDSGVKKRRGRPPGQKNKPKSAPEFVGFGVPCTQEQAEVSAKVCMSMTTPAYNSLFMTLGRPELQKEELEMQRDSLIEYAKVFGDPFGKWAPVVGLVMSGTAPIITRVMPADFGGLTHETLAKMRKLAAEEAEKLRIINGK